MDFHTSVPAKCILAGEHVIVHRGFAFVTPFSNYTLTLGYTKDSVRTIQTISTEGENSLSIMLWPVVSNALMLAEKNPAELTGFFTIHSSIPIGAGLGFSAALCVAVARWCLYYGLISQAELFEFAIELENEFHIKSSGLDIAGVMSSGVIKYTANHEIQPIEPRWRPHLYVSSSGEKSITDSCVKTVNTLRKTNPELANRIDDRMLDSSREIQMALESEATEGFLLLESALNKGNQCFYDWGLVSDKLHQHVQELKKHAKACKIVGAGYGGHVISLWDKEPDGHLPFKLHRLL
ncbi:mevalonate kinase [Legionella sp. MW5194]|uniref:mevalonate kinase family protein n=1 Tax=Legionella sp. MW5194 TaxID=2662448 RepID=UPI00193EADCB|nr:mevalonate kinase [Legionella sp. MW5194]QRN02787.1 mevalonate kinase [Legionella sp. MW5194]